MDIDLHQIWVHENQKVTYAAVYINLLIKLFKQINKTVLLFCFFLIKIDRCTITGVPENVWMYRYVEGEQLRKGEKLRFHCRLRNHILQGNKEVECLENGQWSDPFPTCGGK